MEILVKDEADATQDATQADASQDATPADTPAEPPVIDGHASPDEPPKAKRGRPVGSKNKVKIVAPEPSLPDPEPESEPEPTPKKARTRAPRVPARVPERPVLARLESPMDAGIQLAAAMLHLLRAEQAERQERKALMYRSWVR